MGNDPNKEIQLKMLEHVKVSHLALDEAKTQLDKEADVKTKVAALIPATVDRLIEHGRIHPDNREKAAAALTDPVEVMRLVSSLADPAVGVRQSVGTPTGSTEKTAAHRGPIDAIGRRTTADARYEQGVAAFAANMTPR